MAQAVKLARGILEHFKEAERAGKFAGIEQADIETICSALIEARDAFRAMDLLRSDTREFWAGYHRLREMFAGEPL